VRVLTSPTELAAYTTERLRSGATLALVPTMGFLHDGHLSLMREGARRANIVAASIFVNPTQFGPAEDLSRYPRDFDGDAAKCASAGVSVLYAPQPPDVYPAGYQTYVSVEKVSQGLCGERRPGHFRGVATVVTKLFAGFRPNVALFGEKDYQQLLVIRALAADLELGVEVVGMPTIREPDGLAMSSRNSYLSAADRTRALALSRGLFSARAAAQAGERRVVSLVEHIREPLRAADLREDYVEIRDGQSLAPLDELVVGQSVRALVAAFVGKTRLIDNMSL
jgi:pantoate--beta-alanine ligase